METGLTELIETIWRIKRANKFPSYVDYIQFPFFRNLELNQRINFEFPFTTFVGPNGSGKSSTLHALYGCPEGKTPYEFWFSSEVDPVEYQLKGTSLRHSFFYSYKDENDLELQVVKARIRREDNPNYWETSRPLLSYGMERPPDGKERNDPINKNVIYFDFRSELSAFDKYFYFETPPTHLINNKKQEYIRYKSRILKNLFNQKYRIASDSASLPINQPIIILSDQELSNISFILGREYTRIEIIRHKLFHNWGFSIRLKNKFHRYSEAFAGSGEIAIVRLVHELLIAENDSLVLLDEPEVSLHPGAQKRLKYFLLTQIKEKRHQVVVSTHSPALLNGLPKEAIKVFYQRPDSGKFVIKENILPEEAFYFIGQEISDKLNIIVEDNLSKKIFERILSKLGDEVSNRFDVKFFTGGASVLQQHISVYSNSNIKKSYFVFDGDQKKATELFDINQLTDAQKTVEYLMTKILEQTGVDIKFYPDGGISGANQSQLIKMMISFLAYYKEHVFYLPKTIPEDIIWSEDVIKRIHPINLPVNVERLATIRNKKETIFEASKLLFGIPNKEAMEDILIKEWLTAEDENYLITKSIIKEIEIRVE